MTVVQKAALCTGATPWTTTPVESLGIPEIIMSDGPHGVRRVPDVNAIANKSFPATCFPTASCLASTWDLNLMYQVGQALELQPGETKSVSIQLDSRAFAYYHPEYQQWITETGDFDILVAASAADIRHKLTVTMISTLQLPSLLEKESTIREWTADPCGNAVITPLLEKMVAISRQAFGDDAGTEGIGMNIMDMFMDMPLLSVLMFQQSALSTPPDEIVDGLLMQVHNPK